MGIYWVNHRHLVQAVHGIHGPVLWSNLHLLFWLSLIPFTSGWYALGVALALVHPWLGFAIYVAVAALWFIPDRRIEQRMMRKE